MTDFKQRWAAHWAMLGLPADAACLERLLEDYAASGRHYHTQQHLAECLDLFDEMAELAAAPGAVAIALWFHDAVYVPLASDNEERSAAWAYAALRAAGASTVLAERVQALIMATQHHAAFGDGDMDLVVDIDLAILGAAPARFAQYEQQVRAEYAMVPASLYGEKRRAVLARFLARPVIYSTPALRTRFEAQARENCRTDA